MTNNSIEKKFSTIWPTVCEIIHAHVWVILFLIMVTLCDSVRGTHSVRPTPDWYLKQRDCEMRHFHVISFGGKFVRALLSDPKSPAHFRIVWYFLLFFEKVGRKNWAQKNSDNYPRCVINVDLTKKSNAYVRSNLQIVIFWKTKETVIAVRYFYTLK